MTLVRLLPTLLIVPALVVIAVFVVTGTPRQPPVADPVDDSLDPPVRAAQAWLIDNAARDERLIVDDAMAAGLMSAGWNRVDVVEFDDPALESDAPNDLAGADFVVTTPETRSWEAGAPEVAQTIENSVLVATFGTGVDAVEVRKVLEGTTPASVVEQEAAATRADFGAELAQNPGIIMSDADRGLVASGRVDPRIIVVLGALAGQGDVTIAGFPIVDGEQDRPIRQVAVSHLGGVALVAEDELSLGASDLIRGLLGPYAPQNVSVDSGSVVLRYSLSLDPIAD